MRVFHLAPTRPVPYVLSPPSLRHVSLTDDRRRRRPLREWRNREEPMVDRRGWDRDGENAPRGARGGAKGNTEREREREWLAEEAAAWRESPVQRRRHAVCGATILIRRWIYGLNHRRIISDSRALLPPTETYACLFADNCIPVYLSPPLLYISSSLTFVLSTLRTHLPPLPSPSLRRDSILSRLDSGFRSPRGGGKRRRKRGRGREGGIGWHDDEKSNPSNG